MFRSPKIHLYSIIVLKGVGVDSVNDRVAPMFGFITQLYVNVVIIILLASKNRPTKRNLNVLILGPKESNALYVMYRLGTRKQNNGAGRADCNFCRLSPYSLLTHPNPTRSDDAHKIKK